MDNNYRLTNLKQDKKYNEEFAAKNFKTLRYYTDTFNDPKVNLNKLLAVQEEFSNASNSLRYSEVVADRQKTILPPMQLATTPSLIRGQQNVIVEDELRPEMAKDRKSCNPKDNERYLRQFYIFEGLPVTFNSVKTSGVQDSHSLRGGINTRAENYDQ